MHCLTMNLIYTLIIFCIMLCGCGAGIVPLLDRKSISEYVKPLLNHKNRAPASVCCVQNDWEAKFFLDSGIVFIDNTDKDNGTDTDTPTDPGTDRPYTAYTYFNGTIHTAYSFASKKLYYGISITEMTPLIPQPISQKRTILADYITKTSYSVTDGQCDKEEVDGDMLQLCIPHDAKLLSRGTFGQGNESRETETYQYTEDSDIPWRITATVFINPLKPIEPKQCHPFHATYFTPSVNPDSGTLYSYDIVDLGPIKSQDIFDIPDACKHLT